MVFGDASRPEGGAGLGCAILERKDMREGTRPQELNPKTRSEQGTAAHQRPELSTYVIYSMQDHCESNSDKTTFKTRPCCPPPVPS
jgi:hypothetical protein